MATSGDLDKIWEALNEVSKKQNQYEKSFLVNTNNSNNSLK